MKRWLNSAIGVALLGGAAGIALGQQTPESLLPPGFGDPVQETPAAPEPAAPAQLLPPSALEALANAAAEEANSAAEEELAEEEEEPADVPDYARADPDRAGPLTRANGGLGADAFGQTSGRSLMTLMQRLDAPIASRWAAMLLRRALLTRVETPRGVAAPDWVAERAWLLLRAGEADAARMLVADVDIDRMSPRLVEVAAQVALATADPAGLCPLTAIAPADSKEPIWPLATAMCTALGSEGAVASALIDRARARRTASGIDLLLAEKVLGAGSGRRAVTIEWDGVDQLTAWRFGLATALNVPIPPELFATVGPQTSAWRARAASVPPADRVASARVAAALGAFSSAALVDLHGAIADATDPSELGDTDAGRLRVAYIGDESDRIGALRTLWGDAPATGEIGRARYAALILTARAAARIAPSDDHESDVATLLGAMFSAGLDFQAARWARVVAGMGEAAADPAWALLAVGTPRVSVESGADRVEAYASRADPHRARLLIASMAGLGRLPAGDAARLDEGYAVGLAAQNSWTRTIDAAAARGERGTVALLAAVGMQTTGWRGVSPMLLFRSLRALRAVGLDGEARMIAAEAMTRS